MKFNYNFSRPPSTPVVLMIATGYYAFPPQPLNHSSLKLSQALKCLKY